MEKIARIVNGFLLWPVEAAVARKWQKPRYFISGETINFKLPFLPTESELNQLAVSYKLYSPQNFRLMKMANKTILRLRIGVVVLASGSVPVDFHSIYKNKKDVGKGKATTTNHNNVTRVIRCQLKSYSFGSFE